MTKPTPPILNGAPLLGNALEFQKDPVALFERGNKAFGPVFGIKLMRQNAAVMIGPDYHKLFFTETDKTLSMEEPYQFLAAMFGRVAFTAGPDVYKEQRHILHSPFKREKMIKYIEIMQEETQQWLDSLPDEGEIELTSHMNRLVQNVAANAFMGKQFREEMDREFWDLYVDLAGGLDPLLPPNLPLPKFRRRDRARAKMLKMMEPMVAARRANPDQYDDFMCDFVTMTYKDGRPVEDETVMNLILALLFAGHETTAGQGAWTLIEAMRHPDYLTLIEQELAEKLPVGMPIDGKRLSMLDHVKWAVDETTRTHPTADMVIRVAEEDIELDNYIIPKGWVVFVSSGVAQRQESLFADPDRWDPLRFAPGREEDKQHRFAIIGFGGGVHKCTGMNFAINEMMVITALLFQQFEVELLTPNPTVYRGMGASRPSSTQVRLKRKPQTEPSPELVAEAVAAGCPHMSAMQEQK